MLYWLPFKLNGRILHSWYSSKWWRHQMETFSALLAICAGNWPLPGEFPAQRPVTQSFDVYFDLRPNKRLSKQSWGWWFVTLSCPLYRHRNEMHKCHHDGENVLRPNKHQCHHYLTANWRWCHAHFIWDSCITFNRRETRPHKDFMDFYQRKIRL